MGLGIGGSGNLGTTVEVAEIESLAKGTIIAGDASGAPSSLTVGVDNAILQADSVQASGVGWTSTPTLAGLIMTGNAVLQDNQKVALGTGSDSQIYYDGADSFWDLRATGTGDLMIALAGSFPSPDAGVVHIWKGDAGAISATASGILALEGAGNTTLDFLVRNVDAAGIRVVTPTAGNQGAFLLGADASGEWSLRAGGDVTRIRFSSDTMAFQQASTIITTTGDLRLNPSGNLAIGGTHTADEVAHIAGAVDGRFVGLLIENSQAAAADSLNETAEIKFGFGGNNDVARITADKLKDYTSASKEDSRLAFWVDSGGTLTQIAHFMPDGLMLLLGDSRIRFAGTAGGGGQSIQYKDSASSNRAAFLFPGSDIVRLCNRAADGVVEIAANTSTGGNAGEVIVAKFQDDQITFLASGGNIGIGGIPLVGFHATGLVEGTGDLKDMVAVFQGATGGTQTGFLFTSDDVASDVWLAFRGIPSDTNQWLMGARFFSGDTFAIGYGDKSSTMTFPLDAGAKLVITTGGQIGMGTTTPATSAKLELSSTTGALLVTRMTTTQRDALTAVDGMIIYNTTTTTMQGRTNGSWTNL